MIKVHIQFDQTNGGIRRVMEAQLKHLPAFGIQIVDSPDRAHLINTHGSQIIQAPGVPSVNTSHGLYWSRQNWGESYQQANALVIESMKQAVAHTAPSQWVANAIRRGGFFYPEVIYHGIDAEEMQPTLEPGEYVLWNKARADFVSDPNDCLTVAGHLPHIRFKTTIGHPRSNVEVLRGMARDGIPHEEMMKLVRGAGVYLATARETFGVGTLEAMAYGVPIAGWDWGGQREIVVQGQTGYLATPGNYKELAACIEACFAERSRLSDNARADALTRWKWEPRIKQYAELFQRVYDDFYKVKRPTISVIVTAYKLDRFLPQCLDSVRAQTEEDFECLVIDDAGLVSTKKIVDAMKKKDKRFKYLATPSNLGLPGARNYGFSKARGRYIRHLDADDFLAPNDLEILSGELDTDPGTHIAYGHLEVVREDGSRILQNGEPIRNGWPPDSYNWYQQMMHLNQLPSCAMIRREVFERTGGYRERMKRAEDAEFWCRATSLGFVARKVTQAVTYYHRERADSKGATEWKEEGKEGDWTAWFPWRMGAKGYEEGMRAWRVHGNNHPKPYLVPFGAQGKPTGMHSWYVHDYAYPLVSIIVTMGPGHEKYLIDALDSIQGQTYPDWECIVVNDTGYTLGENIMGAPWVKKVINHENNFGASRARNAGIKYARGKWIVWLDADDIWLPWFLERLVAHGEVNDGVIFSDFIEDDGGEKKIYHYPGFEASRVPFVMQHSGSSVLVPRWIVQKLIETRGYAWDEEIPGYEDGEFQTAMYDLCACAYHVEEPLFVYRKYTTTKREKDYNNQDAIMAYLDQKWAKYRKGEKVMGCGCGAPRTVNNLPSTLMKSSGNFGDFVKTAQQQDGDPAQMVTVEYLGERTAPFTVRSVVMPHKIYRFAQNETNRRNTMFLQDAEHWIAQITPPEYRIVGAGGQAEVRDPTVFLGEAIVG